MPVVGFLTCNGSDIFCRPKLRYIDRLDTELICHLQHSGPWNWDLETDHTTDQYPAYSRQASEMFGGVWSLVHEVVL